MSPTPSSSSLGTFPHHTGVETGSFPAPQSGHQGCVPAGAREGAGAGGVSGLDPILCPRERAGSATCTMRNPLPGASSGLCVGLSSLGCSRLRGRAAGLARWMQPHVGASTLCSARTSPCDARRSPGTLSWAAVEVAPFMGTLSPRQIIAGLNIAPLAGAAPPRAPAQSRPLPRGPCQRVLR